MAEMKDSLETEVRNAQIEYEKLVSHIDLYIAEMRQSMHTS